MSKRAAGTAASAAGTKRAKVHGEEDQSARDGARAEERAEKSEVSPSAPQHDYYAPPDLPRNTSLPAKIEYARRAEGCTRLAIWNITSLKSSDHKGLMRYLHAEDADVVFLAETKVNKVPEHAGIDAMYKYRYWGIGERKGYAGVAVLSKQKPVHVAYGLPGFNDPSTNARLLTVEFPRTVLVGTYAVNAGERLKTLSTKNEWNAALEKHLLSLPKDKAVIWCGDLNVVGDDRDVAEATRKWNKAAGYTADECDGQRRILAATHMCDVWRELHPDAIGHYTFYGWRANCRQRGSGWRLDTFIVRRDTLSRARECEIRYDIYGASDHMPVMMDWDGEL